jgi:hypothetical protein
MLPPGLSPSLWAAPPLTVLCATLACSLAGASTVPPPTIPAAALRPGFSSQGTGQPFTARAAVLALLFAAPAKRNRFDLVHNCAYTVLSLSNGTHARRLATAPSIGLRSLMLLASSMTLARSLSTTRTPRRSATSPSVSTSSVDSWTQRGRNIRLISARPALKHERSDYEEDS